MEKHRLASGETTYTAVVERCPETGFYVGYVPGLSGARSQAETLEELNANLREVISLILEDGPPPITGEFVGTQIVVVAQGARAADMVRVA